MNKVITINLNGVAYQLEEGGYDALRAYLENAARRLEGNPDKDEIITDIEQAIADKFRALLGAYKTVVNTKEVAGVLAEMGPVEDGTSGSSAASADAARDQGQGSAAGAANGTCHREEVPPAGGRRLYRIEDGAMLTGVCNGIAAYVNVDVTFIRLGFALMTFLWGMGLFVYLVLAIIVPPARTSTEKAAAAGMAATAQEFIKRAREGYYEGMKSFHDKASHRAWKRKFRQEMRGWKHGARQSAQSQYWKNWSYNWTNSWQQNWDQRPVPVFGPVFIAPLLSIMLFALLVLAFYAVYSLFKWHALFGVALPATLPLWVAILLVVIAYQFASWPLKALRHTCYFPGGWGGPPGLFGGLLGSLIGLFFLGFGIWSLDRHVPEFHEWLVQLPGLMHQLIDTVQGWFAQKGGA